MATAPWKALLLVLAMQASVFKVFATQCGQTVLKQNFDSYPGPFRFWTIRRVEELFPKGPARRSGDGAFRESGV